MQADLYFFCIYKIRLSRHVMHTVIFRIFQTGKPEQSCVDQDETAPERAVLSLRLYTDHPLICMFLNMSCIMRKPTFWFPTWSDTNQAVQLQKMTRGLKFWI